MSNYYVITFRTDKFAISDRQAVNYSQANRILNSRKSRNIHKCDTITIYTNKTFKSNDERTNYMIEEIYKYLMTTGKTFEASIYLDHIKLMDEDKKIKLNLIDNLIENETIVLNGVHSIPINRLIEIRNNIRLDRDINSKPKEL